MIRALVDDSKGRLHRISLIVKWHDLHDIRVADADGCSVGQRNDMLVRLRLSHQRDHLQNVVVEHEHDERASLPKEDRIWRLFLVVQYLLTDVAAADNFNLVLAPVIADQSNCEVRKDNEKVVWRILR